MMRSGMVGIGFVVGCLIVGTVGLPSAAADDPRPTSNWGSMPNGWAGYSLQQNGLGFTPTRPPLAHGNHHGHGHHGHGHHGHGHHGHHGHGHGHHGHHGHWYPGYPAWFGYGYRSYFGGPYITSGLSFSYGVPSVAGTVPHLQAMQAQQMAAMAARRAERGVVAAPLPANGAVANGVAGEGAEEIRRRVAVLRESNAGGRQRADRLIAMADRYFADQEYRRAASKYRQALVQAADYPTTHFRLGHAYVATGDWQLALDAFLVGFELAGSIVRDGFSLEEMYRGNEVDKQTHIHMLMDAALRQPDDGGLLMLVALTLHYNGDPLRARTYFERAVQLPGAQQTYARMFLPPEDPGRGDVPGR